jgi:hypothetical protein
MENSTSFEDIKALFKETDRRMQETDRRMQETDRQLRLLGKQIGGPGNRLGDFVEGLIRPGLVRMFSEWGIEVHQTYAGVEAERDGMAIEVDLLVVNDTEVIAVEVKSKLHIEHVDEHENRLSKFRRLFPRYADAKLLGALAAMVIPKEAAAYAMRRGFFVIGEKGDNAALLNPPTFQPKIW